ncbi:MAG: hypothetical protein VX913_12585 [Planctomycetota bacterium]|nr:hypothetical protein [Planctomycetota bacterium]
MNYDFGEVHAWHDDLAPRVDRLTLMKAARNDVIGPRGTFMAAWTNIMAERSHARDI